MEQHEVSKKYLFEFIVKLGVFSAMQMDWHCFGVMNQTACALLEESGLLEEYMAYASQQGKIPQHIMPVGSC